MGVRSSFVHSPGPVPPGEEAPSVAETQLVLFFIWEISDTFSAELKSWEIDGGSEIGKYMGNCDNPLWEVHSQPVKPIHTGFGVLRCRLGLS